MNFPVVAPNEIQDNKREIKAQALPWKPSEQPKANFNIH